METKVTHVAPPMQVGRYTAMVGSIIVIIAAFLAWGTVDGITANGVEGDGKLTFILSLIALILLLIRRIPIWVTLIFGVVIEAISIIQNINMNDKISELKNIFASSLSGPDITGNIGIGVYFTIVGAALIIFGSLWEWIKNRKK